MNEEDYKLIQALPRCAYGAMTAVNDVSQFVANIVENPQLGCIAKLRRGSFKKVLADSRFHFDTPLSPRIPA